MTSSNPHLHCRCMNIGKTCPNRHYVDCDICSPEVCQECEETDYPFRPGCVHESIALNCVWNLTNGKMKTWFEAHPQEE